MINGPSEFIFYSYLIDKFIIPGKHTITNPELSKVQITSYLHFDECSPTLLNGELFDGVEYSNTKVFGFHRKFLAMCGPEHIAKINEYLRKKGFEFQFK